MSSQPEKRLKHPEFETREARLKSFQKLPFGVFLFHGPVVLADAGFFHQGPGDSVRCFCCDGGLKNFQRGDDPWEEHARWFPGCNFVRENKSREFICKTQIEDPAQLARIKQDQHNFDVAIASRMATDRVQQVLKLGYPREIVKQVISSQFAILGDDFPNTVALVEAVLAAQDAEAQVPTEKKPAEKPTEKPTEKKPTEKPAPDKEEVELENQLKKLIEEKEKAMVNFLCVVCLEQERQVITCPCGHFCCCRDCNDQQKTCPLCRKITTGKIFPVF